MANPKGRPTAEESAIIFEREKAEARTRNAKRNAAQQKANKQKGRDGQFVSTKSRATKLNTAMKQMLDRVIRESAKGFVTDVDWFCDVSMKRRKSQLTNIKDLLSIVKQMRDLIGEVEDDEATDSDSKAVAAATVTLLKDASKTIDNLRAQTEL